MHLTHEWVEGFSKSFGLIYLLVLSAGITLYAFWPAHKERFDKAAESILDDEDGPCR